MGHKLKKISRGGLPTPPCRRAGLRPARRKLIRRGKKMISKEGGTICPDQGFFWKQFNISFVFKGILMKFGGQAQFYV